MTTPDVAAQYAGQMELLDVLQRMLVIGRDNNLPVLTWQVHGLPLGLSATVRSGDPAVDETVWRNWVDTLDTYLHPLGARDEHYTADGGQRTLGQKWAYPETGSNATIISITTTLDQHHRRTDQP